jgi:predicted ATPase/DNA-binding SARP family transcriptional activator
MLAVKTLGGLSIEVDGKPVQGMGSNKAVALLVFLLVEGGQHSRDEILTMFWPESTQEHAATSLRVALSTLRKTLGDYLDIRRESVSVNPDATCSLDVFDLEGKLACGKIEQAAILYRGDFLQGFKVRESPAFEGWCRLEQETLLHKIVSALHALVDREIEAGNFDKCSIIVKRLLELDPFDEHTCFQSILLLALKGQRSAALVQYTECCKLLLEELGQAPSSELCLLHERLQKGAPLTDLKPALPGHHLPVPGTSFVGRETELAKVCALLRDPTCRLVTLVGPGGSGKTRLAIQAAAEVMWGFQDGAYFVPMEPVGSADYMIPAIAQALHFTIDSFVNGADLRTQILDYLRKRSLLLVLDGCEKLSGRTGDLTAIIEGSPRVRVLATSRQSLGLQIERSFPLEGLRVPLTAWEMRPRLQESVQLFRERACQAGADNRLTEVDYEPIVCICRMVEGMPLGIELAAAWTSILSPAEIAEETAKSFDFLSTSMGDVPEKHQSLRAVFEGSWSLLGSELRQMFSKLSIFPGDFDRKAAWEVAGVNPEQLLALVNRSLIRKNEAGRFTIHNQLRQYTAEKLSEECEQENEVRRKFCDYYVGLLTQRETSLLGSQMVEARDEIRPEMDNLRTAVNWAISLWAGQPAREMLRSLVCFYALHGWQEGVIAFRDVARIRLEQLISCGWREPEKDPVYLSSRIHEAFFLCNLGEIAESEAISRECLAGLQQPGLESELSECLQNLGVNASYRGEYKLSKEFLEKAIIIGKESDNPFWHTYLLWLGYLYFLIGEYEQGMLSLKKSYELFDRKGNLWGKAFAWSKIALAEDGLGDHAHAKEHHQNALAVFEQLDSQAGIGYALSRMSMSTYFMEDYPEAARLAQQGYETFEQIGHRWGICTSLCAAGFAHIGLGELKKARNNFRDALKESRSDQVVPQSMYAIIGLACILAQEGDEARALELVRFVQNHPETPEIYLQQAERWIAALKRTSLRSANNGAGVARNIETVDEVITRVLGWSGIGQNNPLLEYYSPIL